jgi:hypothetical protein
MMGKGGAIDNAPPRFQISYSLQNKENIFIDNTWSAIDF